MNQLNTQENQVKAPSKFDLENFKKATQSMIATNNNAYQTNHLKWDRVKQIPEYTVQQAKDIVRGSNIESQRILSNDYYNVNGYYKQIITHYSTLLNYYGILIPNPNLGKSLQDKPIAKRYYGALNFVEEMNVPVLGQRIANKVLVDGNYFGVIQTLDKNTFVLMDLPFKYCRTRFEDGNGRPIVEFNVQFFNSISDEKNRKAALETYPKIISSYYRKWQKSTGVSPWIFLPTDVGVAFNLFNARPYFLSIIPATIQYDIAVENELEREIDEAKKIIVQEIDHLNDGTLLFEPTEVEEMHNGTVGMIKHSNPNTSVITSYGKVKVESVKSSDASTNTSLKNMLQNVYSAAGASGEIFAATGSSSLGVSLEFDTALMMVLANKISVFITDIINSIFSNGSINFKYSVLPVTCHNNKTLLDNFFKMASSGYSFLLPSIACGLSQRDLSNVKMLENDLLKLQDSLIPLASAYTQSGNSQSEENVTGDEAGRPEKEDLEKTEKTIENIESKDKTGG